MKTGDGVMLTKILCDIKSLSIASKTDDTSFYCSPDTSQLSGRHSPLVWQTLTNCLADTYQFSGRHLSIFWQTLINFLADTYQLSGRHLPIRHLRKLIMRCLQPLERREITLSPSGRLRQREHFVNASLHCFPEMFIVWQTLKNVNLITCPQIVVIN